MSAKVVLCCGSGGVGKTTISAALAVRWAMDGARVAVLTIDPARRLADSLGIDELGNTPQRVPLNGAVLDAAMLDAKQTFDEVVTRLSPSPEAAQKVLDNRYYQFAATGLTGAHEYMAQEKLLQLHQSDQYDIVVLDTPPTRQALDFLRAPDRMASLMDEGVLRWLMMPASKGGWRALELGSEAVAKVLRTLLGEGTVTEIGEFFEAFRGLAESFRTRSLRVRSLLRDPNTRFLLVTTPTASAQEESLYFLDVLQDREMPFGGFVVNRAVTAPKQPLDPSILPDNPDWKPAIEAVIRAPQLRAQRAAQQKQNMERLEAQAAHHRFWPVRERLIAPSSLQQLVEMGEELPASLW